MIQINLKRVYDSYEEKDGFRVLVDRLWPRGVKKEVLHCDLWAKDITPSSELRIWYHEDMENRWIEFSEMYRKELQGSDAVNNFIREIRQYDAVTFIYASKDSVHNHAIILKSYLEELLN